MAAERRRTAFGRPTVQSIDRALDVLEALAMRRAPTGISELATHVGLHVSTVHRLLATLVDRGYVRQDPETSRYHLGSRVFALAEAADAQLDLRLVARPYLERLMRLSGETANLVICGDNEVVYADQVESMRLMKMFTQPGMRAPMYATASGKIFLAFAPERYAGALPKTLHRFTAHTITSVPALEAHLRTIRRDRYSVDDEEMEEGVRCLASPIFDRSGEVVGALSISGPSTRLSRERVGTLAPNVRDLAFDLSRQLGYDGKGLVAERPGRRISSTAM